MTLRSLPLALSLAAALLAAPQARSEVRAGAVYEALQGLARDAGGRLEAQVVPAGAGKLVLRDLTFTPAEGPKMVFGPLTLTETPTGAVALGLPQTFDLVLLPKPRLAPWRPDRVVFKVATQGFDAQVRALGTGQTSYAVRAGSVSVTLDRTEPAPPKDQVIEFSLAAADLLVDWHQAMQGRAATGKAQVALGTLHADLRLAIENDDGPPGLGKGDLSLDLAGLGAGFGFVLPDAMGAGATPDSQRDMRTMLDLLDQGFVFNLSARAGAFAFAGNVDEPGQAPILLEAGLASASGELAINRDAMGYRTALGAGQMRVAGDFPDSEVDDVGLGWQGFRHDLRLGLGTLTGPQPWSFIFDVSGLTLSDLFWARVDPTGALPRDPATLVLELSGSYTPDPVVLAPGGVMIGDAVPLDALSTRFDKALLSLLGVEITASGALEFDFTKVIAPEDPPEAEGSLSFVTRGAATLIDRIAAAGLVPESEVSGLRLGLLFLGRAGDAPDTLTTSIELRDGGMWLNGQKIK